MDRLTQGDLVELLDAASVTNGIVVELSQNGYLSQRSGSSDPAWRAERPLIAPAISAGCHRRTTPSSPFRVVAALRPHL